jgi:hypothetical protein
MFLFLSSFLLTLLISVGSVPPVVNLSGKDGKMVNGNEFSTKMIKGKVYLVLYVDPDVRKKNDKFVEKIKEQHFDKSKFGSIVIINMSATWLPNFALNKILKKKQKEFPDTIYVKDYKKVFVKKWGLKDDDYNVLLFDKDGNLIFYKSGKMSEKDTKRVIELIKKNLE